MEHGGKGLVDQLPPVKPQPPGEVHVIAIEEEIFRIEAPHLPEGFPPGHDACAGGPLGGEGQGIIGLVVFHGGLPGFRQPNLRVLEGGKHHGQKSGSNHNVRVHGDEVVRLRPFRQQVQPTGCAGVEPEEPIVEGHPFPHPAADGVHILLRQQGLGRRIPVHEAEGNLPRLLPVHLHGIGHGGDGGIHGFPVVAVQHGLKLNTEHHHQPPFVDKAALRLCRGLHALIGRRALPFSRPFVRGGFAPFLRFALFYALPFFTLCPV